jgi:hypothetical protein
VEKWFRALRDCSTPRTPCGIHLLPKKNEGKLLAHTHGDCSHPERSSQEKTRFGKRAKRAMGCEHKEGGGFYPSCRYRNWPPNRFSNKSRGLRGQAQAQPGAVAAAPTPQDARQRWAALLKQVYEVDSLPCPKCGGTMKIISFIERRQHEVIEKILRHCGLCLPAEASACAGQHADRSAQAGEEASARAPPSAPEMAMS